MSGMKIEAVEEAFWQIKEQIDCFAEWMEQMDVRIDTLEEQVTKLRANEKSNLPKPPEVKCVGRHHPKFSRIRSRVKGVLNGLWSPYFEQIGYWCTNNHPDWTIKDMLENLENLKESELDELAAILEVK